jgi:hypothetical protein
VAERSILILSEIARELAVGTDIQAHEATGDGVSGGAGATNG